MLARLFLILLLLGLAPVLADSPLTSTDIWQAYEDLPEVRQARETRLLEGELLNFLSDEHALDQQVAVLNALSWDKFTPPGNATRFRRHLGALHNIEGDTLTPDALPWRHSFLYGYLIALEGYGGSPDTVALPYIKPALRARPESFTVVIVDTLIKSQGDLLFNSGRKIWKLSFRPLNSRKLQQDMRPQARAIIHEYLSLYRDRR